MKNRFMFFAVLCLLGTFPLAAKGGAEKTSELVLLHTNDHHGTILPNGGRGGLAERAAYIKAVRAAHPQVLLVDAGDMNTGSALSNMFAAEPDIMAYNLMAYDAATFGNHEFDGTLEKLLTQIKEADFPFVSSNIKTADGSALGGTPFLVKKYRGFKVGIFGITTLRTKIVASPDKSLVFVNEIDAAREVVERLRRKEKADIIIGITHIGDVKEADDHITSPELAAAVPGIDIIIDGHSHSFMEAPLVVNGTYIVTAGEWGKYVGEGVLSVSRKKIVGFDWQPVRINSAEDKEFEADAEAAALIAPYIEKADASLKEVVGEATGDFVFGNRLTRYQETALGNLICDGVVWYFRNVYKQDVDFAFHNGGGIRAGLPAGPITRESILTILPFENYLFAASLKGSDIIELFDFIATIPQGAGGWPQFSKEVRYTIDYSGGEAGRISALTINGAPVDPARTYRFCTNDYILGGGDGYTVLTRAENQFNASLLLSYVVTEYIRAQGGSVSPATDGRIRVIAPSMPTQ